MSANYTHRTNCRLCDHSELDKVVPLNPIPLPDNFLEKHELDSDIEFFPVDVYMCQGCGHVQLLDDIDPTLVWANYSYHSGMAPGIKEHMEYIASKVYNTHKLTPDDLVFDVGSNDGTLLKAFKEHGVKVLGVDPAEGVAKKAIADGIDTYIDLFTPSTSDLIKEKHGSAKVITAFNVFAHASDMAGMADAIKNLLAEDGVFLFEVQYLLDIIDKMLLGTFFHEHICHHSLKPMMKFLNAHGLEIFDVEKVDIQNGSIVGYVQHLGGPREASSLLKEMLATEENRKIDSPTAMKVFSDKLEKLKISAKEIINKCKEENATVAAFGAARSGPTFIAQLGFDEIIEYVVDDHPQKVNKYTPGHKIKVEPIKELYERMPDYTIILAWVHTEKIIETHKEYLDKGGKFIVCYPEISIVSKN